MKPIRVIALVLGCLLVLPALAMLIGGVALALGYAVGRDDDGFFEASLERLETPTVAVTAEQLDLRSDPGSPDRVLDALDVDVRLQVTSADTAQPIFVGIGSERDVDAYLAGTAHDEIDDLDDELRATLRNREGALDIAPPTDQTFWAASASGAGTQELLWEATAGRWAVVIMNADGAPGVAVDTDVGVKAGFIGPLIAILLVVGAIVTVGAVALIVAGAAGARPDATPTAAGVTPTPPPIPAGVTGLGAPIPAEPVSLNATLDPELSRWQWLVKWFLAIPHAIVLFFLWIAFTVLTIVAGFSILFTGSYPRALFDFNVGVLRWTWRVSYYATSGGIGTDRYPPFSLDDDPDYPATLDVDYPEHLSRGLVLVKWWLLAIPHYLILAVLLGGTASRSTANGDPASGAGLLAILVVIAGVILLFTDRYPRSLFDLIIGLNRWVFRVIAYAALMTDRYPPFRLDQGGSEPAPLVPDDSPPPSLGGDVDVGEPLGEKASH